MSGAPPKLQKVMVQPINLIFKHLQNKQRVSIWLYESNDTRLEGVILGFDEFMNLVLDDTEEVIYKKQTRQEISRKKTGRILLKGDNITLYANLFFLFFRFAFMDNFYIHFQSFKEKAFSFT
ncbi:hypothetical protein HMI56_001974 [Coelomomyces lativittatus]|nr:hypothetical protein HMI56_001974 [Coelomomyces lativittatus]